MSKFDPEFYSRFRPFYPLELFAPLRDALKQRGFAQPYAVADIGCGTGHSMASLLRSGIEARVTGVDPDPAMIAKAREICPQAADYLVGSGEKTHLAAASFDAITVGSAFHWMDASQAREEFFRVLRPLGVLLIYEYQFPKAESHPALNEWIRREFNLRWKAPGQRPRGDFETVTACFRSDSRWKRIEERTVPMNLELGATDLTGLVLSQSRVLHYEASMTALAKADFRKQLEDDVRERLENGSDRFDFNLHGVLFELRRVEA